MEINYNATSLLKFEGLEMTNPQDYEVHTTQSAHCNVVDQHAHVLVFHLHHAEWHAVALDPVEDWRCCD